MRCDWGLRMDILILYDVFIYIWIIFGCAVSSWVQGLFSSCSEQGLLSSCSAWASHYHGFSWCRARALDTGSIVGCTGLVAPRHVVSFWTKDQTHVSCIGRWILYHWATREAYRWAFTLMNQTCSLYYWFRERYTPHFVQSLFWSSLSRKVKFLRTAEERNFALYQQHHD